MIRTTSFLILFFCLFFNCTNQLIKPYPYKQAEIKVSSVEKDKDTTEEVDFGKAFDTQATGQLTPQLKQDNVPEDNQTIGEQTAQFDDQVISLRYPPFKVERPFVRVLLKKKVNRTAFYSTGNVEMHPSKGKVMVFRGRCLVQLGSAYVLETQASWGKMDFQLPCTLVSKNELNLIDVEENSYRGSIIINNDKKDFLSIINSVDVEEYLRGVVPLEIGKLGNNAIEALKSQAIAARTYTYQRIGEQAQNYFDLYSTTADQVYGGANVEYREADLAVRLTKNLVLVYNDRIARAYYHSTCGGRTANIEDVWNNKPALPYLRSVSDFDSSGAAYCRGSKQFKWEERWTREKISQYVDKGLKILDPKRDFRGLVKDIRITSTFDCGRVRSCRISADKWTYECGGDIIRSVFRRPLAGDPILRSAKFSVTYRLGMIRLSGTGYGHGVGMCQCGTIARANCGQSFETILKAYYKGIVICTAAFPDQSN